DALEHVLPQLADFVGQPVARILCEERIICQHTRDVAGRLEDQRADLEFIVALVQDRIIELARSPKWQKIGTECSKRVTLRWRILVRPVQCDRGALSITIDGDAHARVVNCVAVKLTLKRREFYAAAVSLTLRAPRNLAGTLRRR